MKMYIPEISDEIRLLADWTFELFNEGRNGSLMEKIGDPRRTCGTWANDYGAIPCTIPAGAVLKIDRIYIRKGKGDYSSITFLWKGEALPAKTETYSDGSTGRVPRIPIRFWAKLDDVNNIEFEKV